MSSALVVVVLGLAPATAAGCIVPDGHRVVERTDEAIVTLETVGEDEDPLDGETVERTWRGCDFAATRVVELHRGQSSLGAFSSPGLPPRRAADGVRGDRGDQVRLGGADRHRRPPRRDPLGERPDLAGLHPGGPLPGRIAPIDTASRPLTDLRVTSSHVSWRERGRRRVHRF